MNLIDFRAGTSAEGAKKQTEDQVVSMNEISPKSIRETLITQTSVKCR